MKKRVSRILSALLVLLALVSLSACGTSSDTPPSDGNQGSTADTPNQEAKQDPAPSTPKEPTFDNGTYLVGTDIQSGLYRAKLTDKLTKMAYIERASDVSMSFDDIIANIILTGDGYVTIKDTDAAVRIQGAELSKLDLASLTPDIKTSAEDGMYLVGYDLAPGTYKVEVTDTMTNMGYVERLSDASMDFESILANEIIQGPGYVKILAGDFAVRVQGASLTLQEG